MSKEPIIRMWTDEEKESLHHLLSLNTSAEKIADHLKRGKSSVYSEIKRGGGRDHYDPKKSKVSVGEKGMASVWKLRFTEEEFKQNILSRRQKGYSWATIAKSLRSSKHGIQAFVEKNGGCKEFPLFRREKKDYGNFMEKILISLEILLDKQVEILQLLKKKE